MDITPARYGRIATETSNFFSNIVSFLQNNYLLPIKIYTGGCIYKNNEVDVQWLC